LEISATGEGKEEVRVYTQQAQNFESERKAGEIRIRAERPAGELLREMKQTGARQSAGSAGGHSKKQKSCNTGIAPGKKLKDLGIIRDQSSKWQQLANVPKEEFEQAMSGSGPIPSTEGIINAKLLRENPLPKMDLDGLWLWGRLRDLEQRGILKGMLNDLLSAMTDPMRDDCKRIAPSVLAWPRPTSDP
jgi:hypothetical protein